MRTQPYEIKGEFQLRRTATSMVGLGTAIALMRLKWSDSQGEG
jgi:hypothetical protein